MNILVRNIHFFMIKLFTNVFSKTANTQHMSNAYIDLSINNRCTYNLNGLLVHLEELQPVFDV